MTMAAGLQQVARRTAAAVVLRLGDARGWWGTGLLTALAAALRLPHLGTPHAFSFDETYYAKDALSLLRFGYERSFVNGADALLLDGDTNVFRDASEFVVHPPLGKWAIAIGEAAFGMNPFGWRIVMAILGIAAVALLHRVALRLTSSPVVAGLAGLFLAIDGMAIVLSRTALLDQTLMFFVLVTLHALVRDRDAYAHTLALREYGAVPRWRWLRPWRLLAIIAITAAFATKWSALWFAIGFALLALGWDAKARRQHDTDRSAWLTDLGWLGVAALVGVGGYLASWLGWFRSTDAWDRTWNDGGVTWLPQPLRALVYYHQQALNFHVHLTSDHPYKASPFWWPLQLRPTSFFFQSYQPGQSGCPQGGGECAAEVLALGNIAIWWAACLTVLGLLATAALRWWHRHSVMSLMAHRTIPWGALAAPLTAIAAGWLPWLWFHERTTFTFYSIVFTPYVCLLAAQGLALFATRARPLLVPAEGAWPPAEAPDGDASAPGPTVVFIRELHSRRALLAGLVVLFAIGFSAFVYPLWTGATIPYSAWQMRMWLGSWI